MAFGSVRAVSNWKIVNLLDVDDSAAGRVDGLEVRMSRNRWSRATSA